MDTEHRLEEMENSLEDLKKLQQTNGQKLDEVLGCLKGNDMGTTGLVREVATLKVVVYDMKNKSLTDKARAEIYLSAVKWLGAIIGSLIIAYMFNQIYS